MKGLKHDQKKPNWALLPMQTIEDVVRVLDHGAVKYKPNNWKYVRPKSRYFAAALRHLSAYQSGEKRDPDSKLPHLAHAICSLIFLHYKDTHR